MRGLFVLLAVVLFAGAVSAQEDITTRPTAATAPWQAGASELGAPSVSICLVTCMNVTGGNYIDPLNHLHCAPVGTITSEGLPLTGASGEVSNPLGAGDACYHAVAISATAAVSEPSENKLTVLDLPTRPMFVR